LSEAAELVEEHRVSARWYIVHAYSNFEKKVAEAIREQAERQGLQDKFEDIRVPTEEVVEIKNGKKVTGERKKYPGYVLVEMVASQDTLHEVSAIQGVIKFVGKDKEPAPLRDDEVRRLLGIVDEKAAAAPVEEIPFLVGQAVQITEGPFTDFNGTVEEVMPEKGKVRVSVSLFGRPTSVELDYLQLKGY
jgi:transcriptional antiterminator NusG